MELILGPTTNWRQCNGATLSKTTYPELFAVIGYTYGGSGDNFELPNLRGKFVTGVGPDSWNNTLNETGGRSDAILPAHNHDITDPGHNHDFTLQNRLVLPNMEMVIRNLEIKTYRLITHSLALL